MIIKDWRNLPAGPELDALVAHLVLGWINVHVNFPGNWATVRGIPPEYVDKQPEGRTVNFPGNKWSRVISSAWDVVEAMERRGYSTNLHSHVDGSGRRWTAEFWEHVENTDMGHGDTAPLAICRAALAALEVAGA